MNRKRQIELMETAEERMLNSVRRWIETTPKLKTLLYRRKHNEKGIYVVPIENDTAKEG